MGLKGWKYVREIQINSGSTGLQDYVFRLELDSGNFDFSKPKPDGSDIRFTDSDSVTSLDYYIKNYNYINQTAIIYVRIPLLLANQTKSIYMYYGNMNAVSQSNESVMTSGFQYNPDPFNDGSCVAYYPFDGDANDYSGNGHHGTWQGNEQYDTGVFGQCAKFDGNSGIKTPSMPTDTSSFTYVVWIRPAKIPITQNWPNGFQNIIAAYHEENHTYGSELRLRGQAIELVLPTPLGAIDDSVYTENGLINSTTQWFFVVVTFNKDTKEAKIYLNSQLKTSKILNLNSFTFVSKHEHIGYRGGDFIAAFEGLIDHVRVFNRVLSDDEITVLSNRLDYTISDELLQSKLSGVIYDKYRRCIKNKQVKIFIIDKDSGNLYGITTSNNDGTWDISLPISPDTKVLTVMALEGEYHGDVDIAGAEYSTTKPSEN